MKSRCALLMLLAWLISFSLNAEIRWKALTLDWNEASIGKDQETGFGLGWFFSSAESLTGVQIGLLFDRTRTDSLGLQLSLGSTYNDASMKGLSLSGFYNKSSDHLGAQVALFGWNRNSGSLAGAQLGLLGNYATGSVSVSQIGGLNIQHEESSGAQIGLFSMTEGLVGVQANIIGSYSSTNLIGGQFGALTWGEDVIGFQVGAFNRTSTIKGLQVGLINVAGVIYGTQIGLINIAREMHGVSIGLLDFIGNGDNHFTYSLEIPLRDGFAEQLHLVGYRFGSANFYKELALGLRSGSEGDWYNLYEASLKIGFQAPLIKDLLALSADVGIGIGNRERTIMVVPGRTILEHLEFQTSEALELRPLKILGLELGLSQRYFIDIWANRATPGGSIHFIETPWWNLYVLNSILVGLRL